jgi:hypothetical protein
MNSKRTQKFGYRSKFVALFLILSLASTHISSSIAAAPLPQSRPGGPPVILRADPNVSFHRTPPPARAISPMRVQSANITINYLPAGSTDAFGTSCLAWPAAAQTAFTYAASIWETLINSSVTIVIHACWADLETGVLGYGGADAYYRDFTGAPTPNTWYPSALANALHGSDQSATDPDMHLAYNKDFQDSNEWYFGTDGNPSGAQYDFVSVVLHEIAHGLGFSGSMRVTSGQGSWGGGTIYPVSYDRFAEDGSGTALINTAVYPNPSVALANALTSGNVWFDGPHANAANGGGRVKLYAPGTWQSGSSYSHLDEIFNGTPNALMTYSLSRGESNHAPGPVGMGILKDVGWTESAPAPTVTSITPNTGENAGSVAVTISGSNFQTGATVKLIRSGQPDIPATGVTVVNATTITGNFDLTGAATGAWNVVVTNPDAQSGTLPNGFTVTFSGKTWTGAISADWHTSGNWTPVGVPGIGDDVLIPAVARAPVIAAGDAAINNLTINSGAVLDLTDRPLTVEGALTNNGTLRQTQGVAAGDTTEFLRITNQASTQVKYYGVDITPSGAGGIYGAAGTPRLTLTAIDDNDFDDANPSLTTQPLRPSNWVTILSENFEGPFPGSWEVSDNDGTTNGEYYWAKRNCQANAGSYSGWAVGGGANGGVLSCGSNYPNNANSWMVYGPFSLADATAADLSFMLWLNSESNWDFVCRAASTDGEDFYGSCTSGSSGGWISRTLDLANVYTLGDLTGQPNVWIALMFTSDGSINYTEGAYVDDIVLRKFTAAPNTPPNLSGLPDQTVPMNGSADNAIDLWDYASDAEDTDADLTFAIVNSPNPDAGVTIDSNRYIDIYPAAGWTGPTDVEVQVQDTGGLTDTDTFRVTVTGSSDPDVEVSPVSFEEVVRVDGILTRTLTISNTGGASLIFLISDDASWLSENPGSGAIPAGGSQSVDVIFDAAGLAMGDYTTDITIVSNDPDEGLVTVPVTMHVTDNTPPVLAGIPDQVVIPGSAHFPLDLWPYASDAESADDELTFTIDNTPDPNAGVSIASNRYVNINPTPGWTGQTTVVIRVTDPGGLSDTDAFLVTVGQFPDIDVTPTFFDESVPQDETLVRTLTIGNTGVDDLIFVIGDGGVAWLSQDPIAGTVAGGAAQPVDVTFDATGLAEGDYFTTLTISNNDPDENPVTIPVTMHVTVTGDLAHVTVSVSGNQFCAGRTSGVKRCFDIEPDTPISATARFYFREAERNGQTLNDLLVLHYMDGEWVEETGPYTRGGSGDAQYVEVQNVDDFSFFALGRKGGTVYLPFIARRYPPVPDVPVLNPISNDDGDGNYTVTWNAAYLAETYTLQEATDAAFSSPTTRYTGSGTSWTASSKPTGTYYYRVRASRLWQGQQLYSGWSTVRSVRVSPPTTFYPTADTTVLQGVPNSSFGNLTRMRVGYDMSGCYDSVNGQISRGLIKFDLSSVPPGTSIVEARLYLNLVSTCYYSGHSQNRTVTLYRNTGNWTSTTTWNTRPAYAEASGSASIALALGWKSFNVTGVVRNWINGSQPNYGFTVIGPETSGSEFARLEFATVNWTGTSYDPYLRITYTGMAASAADTPTIEGLPNLTMCGPTFGDVLGVPQNPLATPRLCPLERQCILPLPLDH